MGLVNGISINPVDNTFSSQSIPASSTIIHDTISGKGFISISTKGNGNKKVNVVVSIDAGADQIVTAANKEIIVNYGFQNQLIIKSVNTDTVAQPSTDLSETGVTQ